MFLHARCYCKIWNNPFWTYQRKNWLLLAATFFFKFFFLLCRYRLKKIDILEKWLQGADKVEKNGYVSNFVRQKFQNNEQELSGTMEKKINRLCINFERRWQAASRLKDLFLKQNEDWLKEDFILELNEPLPSTSSAGRPRLPFSEQSSRTQRRTASKVSEEHKQDWALLVQAAKYFTCAGCFVNLVILPMYLTYFVYLTLSKRS